MSIAGRLARLVPRACVEHIGSTAVPNLYGKPVIDVMLEWPSGADMAVLVEALESDGFWHWYLDPFRASRLMFVDWADKGLSPTRRANVHVTPVDGDFWRCQIAFRNALRESPRLRDEYAALKRELAARFPEELEAYTDGKTAFIRGVVARL